MISEVDYCSDTANSSPILTSHLGRMDLCTFTLDGMPCFSATTSTTVNENPANTSSVSEFTDDEMPAMRDDGDDVFERNGYTKIGKICDTLQGELFQAAVMGTAATSNQYVAIKRV
eukprot:306053_1